MVSKGRSRAGTGLSCISGRVGIIRRLGISGSRGIVGRFPDLSKRNSRLRSIALSGSEGLATPGTLPGTFSLGCRSYICLVSGISLRLRRGVSLLRLLVSSLSILQWNAVPEPTVEGRDTVESVSTIQAMATISSVSAKSVAAITTITAVPTIAVTAIPTVASVPPIATIASVSSITTIASIGISISAIVPWVEMGPVIIISVVEESIMALSLVSLPVAFVAIAIIVVIVVLVVLVKVFIDRALVLVMRFVVAESFAEAAEAVPLVESAVMTFAVTVSGIQGVSVTVVMQGQERGEVLAMKSVVMAQSNTVPMSIAAISTVATISVATVTTVSIWTSIGGVVCKRVGLMIWPVSRSFGTSRFLFFNVVLFHILFFYIFCSKHMEC